MKFNWYWPLMNSILLYTYEHGRWWQCISPLFTRPAKRAIWEGTKSVHLQDSVSVWCGAFSLRVSTYSRTRCRTCWRAILLLFLIFSLSRHSSPFTLLHGHYGLLETHASKQVHACAAVRERERKKSGHGAVFSDHCEADEIAAASGASSRWLLSTCANVIANQFWEQPHLLLTAYLPAIPWL